MAHLSRGHLAAALGLLLAVCLLPALADAALLWNRSALVMYTHAVSPDGARIAIAAGFGSVALFNGATGEAAGTLATGFTDLSQLALSPDGALLAVAGQEVLPGNQRTRQVRIFDLAAGTLLATVDGGRCAFAPDGLLVTNAAGLTYYDARTGAVRRRLALDETAQQFVIAPKGDLAACMTQKALLLIDGATGRVLRQWPSDSFTTRALAFSPDGTLLAGTVKTDTVVVRRVDDGAEVRTLGGHNAVISDVSFTPDGTGLVFNEADASVRVLALADGTELRRVALTSTPSGFAVSADGTRLIAFAQDAAGIWDLTKNMLVKEIRSSVIPRQPLALSPDGALLALGDGTRGVALVKAADGTPVREIPLRGGVSALAFMPDGRTLAVSGSRAVTLLKVKDGTVIATLAAGTSWVRAVAFSQDSELCLTAGDEHNDTGGRTGVVKIWRTADGALQRTLAVGNSPWCLALSPDGKILATGSQDARAVTLWEVKTGEQLKTLKDQQGWFACLAFSPSGKELYSYANQSLTVYDAGSLKPKRVIAQVGPPFLFTRDGKIGFSRGPYGNSPAQAWTVADGAVFATLPLDFQAGHLSISADGTLVAVSGGAGLAVWRVEK